MMRTEHMSDVQIKKKKNPMSHRLVGFFFFFSKPAVQLNERRFVTPSTYQCMVDELIFLFFVGVVDCDHFFCVDGI
jgi:hypothetical protein